MDPAKLRAWWSHRQGLDGSLAGKTGTEILERSGWARSVGGCGPYLTLFSRGGLSREDADQAVARLEMHELPAARGCTYVVPACDFALALKVGEEFADGEMKTARKLGVTDAEIDKLSARVVTALTKGPLDPDGIKQSVGGAARSLGEEGKKKGVSTTLPLALGKLQAKGEIRRIPVNGRLDQQRYRYTVWPANPLTKYRISLEEAYTELARRYFRWIAPARLSEFQAFAGISSKAAKATVAPLKLAPMEKDSDLLMFAEDVDALNAFKVPKPPQYVLTSSVDGLAMLRRAAGSLIEEADWNNPALKLKKASGLGGFLDLPDHAIFDRGRLVGLWLFDSETQSITWIALGKKDKAMESAVERTESYIRDQLGDARSFSLDSPKSRAPRIAELRGY